MQSELQLHVVIIWSGNKHKFYLGWYIQERYAIIFLLESLAETIS